MKAVVLVDIEPKHTEDVFDQIKKVKGVVEALQVYGEYDAVFIIEENHATEIQEFVKTIRKITGILRTVTLIEVP